MKIIVVGGGIAGLYCALHLSKYMDVILVDNREYVGGRIRTHKNPQYEIGALRFRKNHTLLNALVRHYSLQKVKLERTAQSEKLRQSYQTADDF